MQQHALFIKIKQLKIFNDHFVNIGEKLANRIDETNIDPLKNVPETEKGSLLKLLTLSKLKMENQLEYIIFQTRL